MPGDFDAATRALAACHAEDPVHWDGRPRAEVQHERLAHWVEHLAPNASEALRLAARCQHLERWKRPRSDYPEGRRGYLDWRRDAAIFHADRAGELLLAAGYDDDTRAKVRALNTKADLDDPETRTLEDALSLAFLEQELAEFAEKHDEEKLVRILKKTWRKMSEAGHTAALGLPLDDDLRQLVEKAVAAA